MLDTHISTSHFNLLYGLFLRSYYSKCSSKGEWMFGINSFHYNTICRVDVDFSKEVFF